MYCETCPRNKWCQMKPEMCSQKLAERIVMEPEIKRQERENQIVSSYQKRMKRRYLKRRYGK